MYEERFTSWVKWKDRKKVDGIRYPGVYVCAIIPQDISNDRFSWLREIAYVDMTKNLRERLNAFDNTINGKRGHGGAARVKFKHKDYEELCRRLYLSIWFAECDVKPDSPNELRIMGEVAKFEYDCLAHYAETFHSLPEFNDQKRSPKKK